MEPRIENDAVVLFQGDSITDAGRTRFGGPDMGQGYAMMAAAWFSAKHPEKNVRFINRGISGDQVPDLETRWQRDCIDLKPTWLSVLIGINDAYYRWVESAPPAGPEFIEGYRRILDRARDEIAPRLILAEPFCLPQDNEHDMWRAHIDPIIEVVRSLAREFDAILVPLDAAFQESAVHQPPSFWTTDGVHPTPAGHALIARTWLETVNGA